MRLTLTLSPSSRGKPGDPSSVAVFDEAGGSIGRANHNSLILRHGKVSGQHALVTFRSGSFYIEDDESTNGTAVNSPSNWLVPHRPYAMEDGDRVIIDPYEIDVTVDDAAVGSSTRDDRFRSDSSAGADSLGLESRPEMIDGGEVDPMVLLGAAKPSKPVARPRRPDPPLHDPHSDLYQLPAVEPEDLPRPVDATGIPVDYDPFAPDSVSLPAAAVRPQPSIGPRVDPAQPQKPRPAEVVSPERVAESRGAADVRAPEMPAPAPARPADLIELLRAVGLPDAALTPELMGNVGEILRITVSGLIDVLQSRQHIKAEFGLRQTIVLRADNNPLKFSANVKDALHNLLLKRNAAYLGPVEAFAEAFDDLRDHQLAMLAGIRIAFEAMLAESDPDQLQASFDRELEKVMLPLVPAKLRYWELYRQRRSEMMRDREAAFQRLFGEAFGRAYEEQFSRLKAQRRQSGRHHPQASESD